MKNAISLIREKFNLTQDELAIQLNLSREFINKMENGKASVSLNTAALIKQIYHIDVNSDSLDKPEETVNGDL